MKAEKIIIIDGSGYIFRAYFAIQRLSTSAGFPTNAIYGFITMLLKVLDVEKPTKLLIAFDTGKATFRKDLYAEYKANRSAPPEDLIKQIPGIQRSVDCFGIHRLEKEGFEADDVIATVAHRAEAAGYEVEIITGDKDLMQLVNEKVALFDTMKDRRIGPAAVEERFGVTPGQIVDLLALMGDASDNIPGVTGIGEKTAAELIRTFGSLDGIYEKLDTIKQNKRRETLGVEKETAYLSQKLATVRRDVPLDFEWEQFNYSGPHRDKLQAFFAEFEFPTLARRFGMDATAAPSGGLSREKYVTLHTEAELADALEALSDCAYVAIDTETTSLATRTAKLVGVSLCGSAGHAYYLPLGHHAIGVPEEKCVGQLDEATARQHLKPFLENPEIKKVGQNFKYDLQIFRNWGVNVAGIAADTLLESYLLDPDQSHNLDALAQRHLGHQTIGYDEVAGKGKNQITFAEVTIEKAAEYSAEDADVTFQLHRKLMPALEKIELTKLFRDVELPLVEVLADMEYSGVLVDADRLRTMASSLETELAVVESRIVEVNGEPININSPKQLGKLLFEKLQLPIIRKTKTGISTDESVLQALAKEHEVCRWILTYRELGKLKSTYVDGLLAQVHPETGRVHTNYNQTVAATGRLSSSHPNLQNIPVGGDARFDIRSVFVPRPGCTLLSADYSQVELRLLADMSGDAELRRAFRNDEDVHDYTGRLIFGTPTVTPDQRRIAKTINFGVVYGQSPYGLSQTLKISPKEAKLFIDTYFARYSGIQKFMQSTIEGARTQGYVTTRLGRRRYLRDIDSKNKMIREMAERAAVNTPIQGTAADMIKVAMVRTFRRLAKEKLEAKLLLQVHDELVLEVPEAEKSAVETLVREEMEQAMELKVPLRVDVGWGANWSECG